MTLCRFRIIHGNANDVRNIVRASYNLTIEEKDTQQKKGKQGLEASREEKGVFLFQKYTMPKPIIHGMTRVFSITLCLSYDLHNEKNSMIEISTQCDLSSYLPCILLFAIIVKVAKGAHGNMDK